MGMDRNTVIGFVLIGLLMMGMFYFNSQGSKALQAEQKKIADSIAATKPKVDTAARTKDAVITDSIRKTQEAGGFKNDLNQLEELTTIENELLKI